MNIAAKSFLTILGLVGLLFPVSAEAAAQKVIKVDASVNTTECPQYLAFVAMKKYIEEKSGGRYRVDVYDSGKLGSPATVLQSMRMGTVHIAAESSANMSAFLPVLGILDAPYLFMNSECADQVLIKDPFGMKLLEPLNKVGIKPVCFLSSAFRWLLMKNPIRTVDDIKGQKVRATASKIDIENLKNMGFSPASVTGPEMLSALQQGTIEGVALPADSVPTERAVADVAKYATGSEHCYMGLVLSCSANWFNGLSKEDQQLMLDGMKVMAENHGRMVKEISSVDSIRSCGLYTDVIVPSQEMKNELARRTQSVYATFSDDWKALAEEIRTILKSAGLPVAEM